jgi:hypothetical protein
MGRSLECQALEIQATMNVARHSLERKAWQRCSNGGSNDRSQEIMVKNEMTLRLLCAEYLDLVNEHLSHNVTNVEKEVSAKDELASRRKHEGSDDEMLRTSQIQ